MIASTSTAAYSITCGTQVAEWKGLRPPQGVSAFRQRESYSAVAKQICERSGYPDLLCILGRGIELYGNYETKDARKPSNWRATSFFERIRPDTRNHTGYWTPHADLCATDMSVGGGNANVRAAYVLLRGLARLNRLPQAILFCAGRTKYVQDLDPTGTVSEGVVMRNKLFGMLAATKSTRLEDLTASHAYLTVPEDKPLFDIARTPQGRVVAIAQYNSNSLDDLRCALALAQKLELRNARFLSVRMHVPRCDVMLKEETRNDRTFDGISTGAITAEEILGAFRPGYAQLLSQMDSSLETTPALAMTCVREMRGTYSNIERHNVTMQPRTMLDSAASALRSIGKL